MVCEDHVMHGKLNCSKRVLKLATYQLQIFLVKYEYLWYVKTMSCMESLTEKGVRQHVLGILYVETRIKTLVVRGMV